MADADVPAPKRLKRSKQTPVNGDHNGLHLSVQDLSSICDCGKCTMSSFLQKGCPKPSTMLLQVLPHVDIRDLTEAHQIIRKGRLYLEYKQICNKFTSLKLAILKSLSDRHVPVESVSRLLEGVGSFQPPQEHTSLFNHHITAIKEAKKLDRLFTFVSAYSSFFNYSLLEHVVDKLGTESDKTEMDRYKAEFADYSKRNLFECPSYRTTTFDSFQLTPLVLRVDKDYSKLSMSQIDHFTDWLCSVFLITRSSILLTSAVKKEGCHVELVYPRLSEEIELSFHVPGFVRDGLLPVSGEQQDMLRSGGVLGVSSDDFQQDMTSQGDDIQTTTDSSIISGPISEHSTPSSEYFNNLTMAQAALLLNPPPTLTDTTHPMRNGHAPPTSEQAGAMIQGHGYIDGYMPHSSGSQFPSFSQHDIASQFLTMDGHNRSGTSAPDQLSGECPVSGDSDSDDGSGKPKPKPAPGKKTRGRVKIPMKYIKNKLRRYTTFSKRKSNIMKKAYELSTLTGTQVMLMVASETGHVYTFATPKLQPMITSEAGKALIQTCLHQPDPSPSLLPVSSSSEQFDVRMSSTGYEEVDLNAYKLHNEEHKSSDKPPSTSSASLSAMSSLLPPTSFPSDIASLMPVLSSFRPPPPLSLASNDYSPTKHEGEAKE